MVVAVEPVTIASVVEGHGEVRALPVLLRRMAAAIAPESFLRLPQPHRVPKSKLVKSGALESAIGAWFLASAPSLAGSRRLPSDLAAPDDPEGIRGAKEWLSEQMTPARPYKETVDQAALTSQLDLAMVRRKSPSFDKLWRDVERLLATDREQDRYEQ